MSSVTERESRAGWPGRTLARGRHEDAVGAGAPAVSGPTAAGPTRTSTADADAEAPDEAEARSLSEFLWTWARELRWRWRLAASMFVLAAAPIVASALLTVPTYTASGVVQVSAGGSLMATSPLLELAGGGANANVETEIELMRRREFMVGVFKDLRLHIVDPAQRSDFTLDLAVSLGGASPVSPALVGLREAVTIAEVDPHHDGDVRVRLVATAEDALRVELGRDGADGVYPLLVGERLKTPALTLQFARLPIAPGTSIDVVLRSDGALYDELHASLAVTGVGGRATPTNLVKVAFTASDRGTAQAVVARLMQRYVEQSLEWQTDSASRAVDFITDQLAEATAQLAEQEDALRSFAEQEGAVQLDTQARATIESVATLEAERLKSTLQGKQMDQVLGGARRGMEQGKMHLTSNFFDDPVLAANIAALTENEVRYEVLKATLTPEHPQVVELAAQLKLQQQEIQRLMRSARRNVASRTAELERQLTATSAALEKYPDKQLRLARLMRAVEVSERLYSFLLEKANEAEILKASTSVDKRVVDAASYPHRKTTPPRSRTIALGLAAGLLAALAAVYLARTLQRTLASIEAITREVRWPLYGMIPALVPAPADGAALQATWLRGPTTTAEGTRALAVNISMAPAPAGRGRIVLLTSSRSGEGKSTTCANLAAALARTGARVLLVDLDLRKPIQHRLWHVPRAPGFVELVTRPSDPDAARQIMRRDATHQVTVLTAGTRAVDTTALLMTGQLEAMLAAWADEYDYIVLDSPPAFVPDTSIVARHADLVLLVARPGPLKRGELRRAVELMARVPTARGLLLNGVSDRHLGFGHGGLDEYYTYGLAQASDAEPEAAPAGR